MGLLSSIRMFEQQDISSSYDLFEKLEVRQVIHSIKYQKLFLNIWLG